MPPLPEREVLRRLGAGKLLLGLSCLAAAWWGATPAAVFQTAPGWLGLVLGASGLTLLLGSWRGRRSETWRLASLALDFAAIALSFGDGAHALHLPLVMTLPAWWDASWTAALVVAAVVLNGAAAPALITSAAATAGLAVGWYTGWLLPAAAASACAAAAGVATPWHRSSLPPDLLDRLAYVAGRQAPSESLMAAPNPAPPGEADLRAAAAALAIDEVAVLVHDTSRTQRRPLGDLHLLRDGRYVVHRVHLEPATGQQTTGLGFLAPPGVVLPAGSRVQPLLGQTGVMGRLIVPSWPTPDARHPERDSARDALLALLTATWSLRLDNHRLAREAEARLLDIVESLIVSVEAKDQYTSGHSTRVGQYSLLLAEALGLNGRDLDEVGIGAALHDVGKLGIPEQILSKPAKLDDAEWALMRSHPKVGARIVDSFNHSEAVLHIIFHHHERYDGRGYPAGLQGDAIPFPARIVCVADALDAMTSSRSYQRNRTVRDALQELRRNAGTQFDPRVIAALLKIPLAQLEEIAPAPPEATGVPGALAMPTPAAASVAQALSAPA